LHSICDSPSINDLSNPKLAKTSLPSNPIPLKKDGLSVTNIGQTQVAFTGGRRGAVGGGEEREGGIGSKKAESGRNKGKLSNNT